MHVCFDVPSLNSRMSHIHLLSRFYFKKSSFFYDLNEGYRWM
ncbi:hypothetical protein AS4_17880 [Acinetobacter guillouiae]|nr:hypothetical protein AS4_17880 [Acinetobacter guillouiae]